MVIFDNVPINGQCDTPSMNKNFAYIFDKLNQNFQAMD